MSTTRTPILSTTHAVFRGLQDELCEIIRDLPDSVPPSLKQGLTDAYRKLSDYYYKIRFMLKFLQIEGTLGEVNLGLGNRLGRSKHGPNSAPIDQRVC